MIRSYFGLSKNPFSSESCQLLKHQQEIIDILKVHSTQGGLCLVMGIPGTGKTVLKKNIQDSSDKTLLVACVSRTLHTYSNTIKILCEAFKIDYAGTSFKCERSLIEEAFSLKRQGKSLITIIDDAHLLEMDTLRRLRLLFEDFPKNNNVILIGQPDLLIKMSLAVNADIKSRVTYSTVMKRLNPDSMEEFIFEQLDKAGLGHNVFTEEALDLIIRSADGVLRRTRNLCISSLLEAVRAQTKSINLKIVNSVLIQPHWRKDFDIQQY
jgi:type II secretory pathway predicted ATPase ExeA